MLMVGRNDPSPALSKLDTIRSGVSIMFAIERRSNEPSTSGLLSCVKNNAAIQMDSSRPML